MTESKQTVLITGVAGFIGFFLATRFLKDGYFVVGIDNFNDYYDPAIKRDRIDEILKEELSSNFKLCEGDLGDRAFMESVFYAHNFDYVLHMGAQAGVRYSLENPHTYVESNLTGFLHILEGCRHHKVDHLIYASSSSVYGANVVQPFSEAHNVDHPVSLYAASKKANELMAHTYSHLYKLPTTGLRFFTVYGPWGRPDMALFKFTRGILNDEPIDVYNHGDMSRDFTYVDDIVESIARLTQHVPNTNDQWDRELSDPATSYAPYRIFNIGNNAPVSLLGFIEQIEIATGKRATKNLMPMQPGDVKSTYADSSALNTLTGFQPNTSLASGVQAFVDWYRSYYNA